MNVFFLSLILSFILINECKTPLWKPDEIKNPLTNPGFCEVSPGQESFLCDPEDILSASFKKKLTDILLYYFLQETPCFCKEGCDTTDYRHRLMVGIVIVTAINETIENCNKDVRDCFAERVLENWNVSQCSGNNGLILITKLKSHVFFGNAVSKFITNVCLMKLKSFIRPVYPYNFRYFFKIAIQYIREPCSCNDSCSYRHLKWLTNIVFFVGVIVLVTCIGGMSRRALVAKFHDRSVMSRNNIFSGSFYRQRLVGVRPTTVFDAGTMETPSQQIPPVYSSLGLLSKPPPYMSSPMPNALKVTSIHNGNEIIQSVPTESIDDQPPPYSSIIRNNSIEPIQPTSSSTQNRAEVHCNNNPGYQS